MRAAILFVVLCVLFYASKPPTWGSEVAENTYHIDKVFPHEKFDIIIFGDSRAEIGISPEILKKKLGQDINILNFGLSEAGLTNEYLNSGLQYLNYESLNNPMVIIAVSPSSLTPRFGKNKKLQECLTLSAYEIWKYRNFGTILQYFDPIKPIDIVYGFTKKKQGRYETYEEHGWKIADKHPRDSVALVGYPKTFINNSVDSLTVSNLMFTITKLTDESVTVIGLRIPSINEMWLLEDTLSGFEHDEIKSMFFNAGGTWLDLKPSIHYESFDASHLTPESAITFSQHLGDSILYHLKNHRSL